MGTPAPDASVPFVAQVNAELARLTDEQASLEHEMAALTARLAQVERQHTALRAWQEAGRRDAVCQT